MWRQLVKNAMVWPFVHDGIPIVYYGERFTSGSCCLASADDRASQAKNKAIKEQQIQATVKRESIAAVQPHRASA